MCAHLSRGRDRGRERKSQADSVQSLGTDVELKLMT